MPTLPSLAELSSRLSAVLPNQSDTVDVDVPLLDLAIDSLDLLEWLLALAEDLGDDELLEFDEVEGQRFFDLSLRELYQQVAKAMLEAGVDDSATTAIDLREPSVVDIPVS